MPSPATCRREIEALHAFFVDWFTGQVSADAFDRLEDALAPSFEMITPDGISRDCSTVLEQVRSSHGVRESGTFSIEIRNIDVRYELDDLAYVRYEEWQKSPDTGTTGRLSSVLFEEDPDTPGGVRWLDLHETWIDSSRPDGT